MKYKTFPSFWRTYESLDKEVKKRAKKSFELRMENPFHPSLHFKCVNKENVWSLRVNRGYRALCIFEDEISDMVLDWKS